jgi:hypothetical protein
VRLPSEFEEWVVTRAASAQVEPRRHGILSSSTYSSDYKQTPRFLSSICQYQVEVASAQSFMQVTEDGYAGDTGASPRTYSSDCTFSNEYTSVCFSIYSTVIAHFSARIRAGNEAKKQLGRRTHSTLPPGKHGTQRFKTGFCLESK